MSTLEDLPGNPHVKHSLKKLLQNTPHALLFEGPKGVGKSVFAQAFAKQLLKSEKKHHPDFRELFPEGKGHLHPMHSLREFIKETEMPPFEGEYKVFLIHEAERMLPTSMNALLKTLEEPVSRCVIILITSHSEALLPTITSRCFRVPFSLLTEEELMTYLKTEKTEEEARRIAFLSQGSLEKALKLSAQEDTLSLHMFDFGVRLLYKENPSFKDYGEIEDPEEALSYLFYFYRDLHLLKEGGDPSYLFYQDKKEELQACLSCPLPSLEEIQEKMSKIVQAEALHIPLSHSFPLLF